MTRAIKMSAVREPPKRVPVIHRVDVAVAGGGISGTMAALASARMGARTLIAERFGTLGGNIGPGTWAGGSLHYALLGSEDDESALINRRGIGGIPEEVVRRTLALRMDTAALKQGRRGTTTWLGCAWEATTSGTARGCPTWLGG